MILPWCRCGVSSFHCSPFSIIGGRRQKLGPCRRGLKKAVCNRISRLNNWNWKYRKMRDILQLPLETRPNLTKMTICPMGHKIRFPDGFIVLKFADLLIRTNRQRLILQQLDCSNHSHKAPNFRGPILRIGIPGISSNLPDLQTNFYNWFLFLLLTCLQVFCFIFNQGNSILFSAFADRFVKIIFSYPKGHNNGRSKHCTS